MARSATRRFEALARPFDLTAAMRELDMFYQGKDPVHKTMHRLVKRLEKAGIPYAIVGGMAVFAHEYRRDRKSTRLNSSHRL